MSIVTNLILTCASGESEQGIIAQLSQFTYNGTMSFQIVSVEDKSLPKDWYGGSKNLEANVFIGAYNHLKLTDLIAYLERMECDSPEKVRLFAKEEHDEAFKAIPLQL